MDYNLLVDVRDQYTNFLVQSTCDPVWEGINQLYVAAQNAKDTNAALMTFQALLKEVKDWNMDVIRKATSHVEEQVPFLTQLLTAVFVTNVKILTAVKTTTDIDFNLHIPSNEKFIFTIYKACAKLFYRSPQLFDQSLSALEIHANVQHAYEIILKCVRESINILIPYGDILQTYLQYYHDTPSVPKTQVTSTGLVEPVPAGSAEKGTESSSSSENGGDDDTKKPEDTTDDIFPETDTFPAPDEGGGEGEGEGDGDGDGDGGGGGGGGGGDGDGDGDDSDTEDKTREVKISNPTPGVLFPDLKHE